MNKALKYILMLVIAAVAAAVLYFLFFGTTEAPTPSNATSPLATTGGAPVSGIIAEKPLSAVEASAISQEFVSQLLNLKAIKLDDDIFSSLAFQSLEDFSITLIQPGNEGRPNPFAPFGIDSDAPPVDAVEGGTATTARDSGLNVTPISDFPPQNGAPLPNPNNS